MTTQSRIRVVFALFSCAAVFCASSYCTSARAQVRLGPKGPIVSRTEVVRRADGPREIFLVIDPAAEPVPALQYSFSTDILDRKAGNAAPFYYRAFWLMSEVSDKNRSAVMEYLDAPLSELKEEKVGELLAAFKNVFVEIQTASVRERCDWESRMKDLDGMKAIEFLLPEMQQTRNIGRLLSVKARWEIATGQYDQAVDTLRQGYRLAIDTGRPRTLVSSLVGIAIAAMMNERVIELIQAEQSPNLYWALAELPRPLVSTRRALELELSWPDKIFPFLRDAETAERTPEEWRRLFREAAMKITELSGVAGELPLGNELAMTGIMMHGYVRAKRRLAEQGFDVAELNKMPAMQVIAIYQSRVNRRIRDEIRKWSLLPHDQAWEHQEKSEAMLQTGGYFGIHSEHGEVLPVAALLYPALSAARKAEARSWTSLNFLQTIEAIRIYAASHDGQLPDSLDDIQSIPVPRDPATMDLFAYERQGKEAILEIPAMPRRLPVARWRVTIRIRD